MKKPPATLTAKWEKILAKEGLAPVGLMTAHNEQNIKFVSYTVIRNDANKSSSEPNWARDALNIQTHELPIAEYFRKLTHLTSALPQNYPNRKFLVMYAETGFLETSARKCGITRMRGRVALKRLLRTAEMEMLTEPTEP